MLYRVLADIVVVLHFLWIVFLVFGAFWGVRRRAVMAVHVAVLAFALLIHLFNLYCPLTYLELWFRARHDPALAYRGSFIVHYLEEIIYLSLPPGLLLFLTILLCAFNAWVYMRGKVSFL